MGKQPEYSYDEKTGISNCYIYLDDFLQGFGTAQCHPHDQDMISEATGTHIAELRAKINLLQNYKNRELHPGMKALKHLKGTMVNSKHYNPDSYESKRLNVEIKNFQKDIEDINLAIQAAKQELYDYIKLKEIMYQRIRKNDHKGYTDADAETLLKNIEKYESKS